jgi:2-dehydro-3-deoxygalactonokinase
MEARLFPEILSFPIHFIPGVRNFAQPVDVDNVAAMDMMRGEETEALGLWTLLQPGRACIFVLPGSHNKFICMDAQGSILGCMTSISGELLDALTHHTILADSVGGRFVDSQTYDREAMLAGLDAGDAGIGRAAFSARILCTLGNMPPEKAANFLLGVVLCTDLQAMESFPLMRAMPDAPVYVAGKEPLQTALCDALAARRRVVQPIPDSWSATMGLLGAMRIFRSDLR